MDKRASTYFSFKYTSGQLNGIWLKLSKEKNMNITKAMSALKTYMTYNICVCARECYLPGSAS